MAIGSVRVVGVDGDVTLGDVDDGTSGAGTAPGRGITAGPGDGDGDD